MGSMINMDDPKHYRLRSIVSKGFTPKEVAKIEGYVRTKARTIVDEVIERFPDRQCDFVEQIAAKLPLQDDLRDDGNPAAGRAAGLRTGRTSSSAGATPSTAARSRT